MTINFPVYVFLQNNYKCEWALQYCACWIICTTLFTLECIECDLESYFGSSKVMWFLRHLKQIFMDFWTSVVVYLMWFILSNLKMTKRLIIVSFCPSYAFSGLSKDTFQKIVWLNNTVISLNNIFLVVSVEISHNISTDLCVWIFCYF